MLHWRKRMSRISTGSFRQEIGWVSKAFVMVVEHIDLAAIRKAATLYRRRYKVQLPFLREAADIVGEEPSEDPQERERQSRAARTTLNLRKEVLKVDQECIDFGRDHLSKTCRNHGVREFPIASSIVSLSPEIGFLNFR